MQKVATNFTQNSRSHIEAADEFCVFDAAGEAAAEVMARGMMGFIYKNKL